MTRLWDCPTVAATESYIQDTTASLETSLASPPGDPEEEYYRDLGYGGDIIEVNTRDWYLMSNSNSPLTALPLWAHIWAQFIFELLKSVETFPILVGC